MNDNEKNKWYGVKQVPFTRTNHAKVNNLSPDINHRKSTENPNNRTALGAAGASQVYSSIDNSQSLKRIPASIEDDHGL